MPPRDEAVVYGLNAALAVARHRPAAIRRVFHGRDVRIAVAPILKAAAAHRRPYREVPPEELEKVAQSLHHEGIVVVTEALPVLGPDALHATLGPDVLLLALDDIGNPHNLGAILRSAAYFGAAGIIVPQTERQASLSAAAVRVAQGGAEVVPCFGAADLPATLRDLAARGVTPVIAETRGGTPHGAFVWPRALCLVLGNEGEGIGDAVRRAGAARVSITGPAHLDHPAVESLNVSVAAGILLAAASGRGRAR